MVGTDSDIQPCHFTDDQMIGSADGYLYSQAARDTQMKLTAVQYPLIRLQCGACAAGEQATTAEYWLVPGIVER